jgi:hypothetical protein
MECNRRLSSWVGLRVLLEEDETCVAIFGRWLEANVLRGVRERGCGCGCDCAGAGVAEVVVEIDEAVEASDALRPTCSLPSLSDKLAKRFSNSSPPPLFASSFMYLSTIL